MSFIADTQQILADYKAGFNAANEKYNKARKENEEKLSKYYITQDGFDAFMQQPTQERTQELEQLYRTASQQVKEALERYEAELDKRYLKTANSINKEDVELLSSNVVNLKARDVEAMFNAYKNAGNVAMMEVVANYELEHETGANVVFYTQEQRKEAAVDYAGGVVSALKDSFGNSFGIKFGIYESASAVPACLKGE